MAQGLNDALELSAVIERCEPDATVSLHKKLWRRHWVVRVERGGVKREYEDVHHYWLERGIRLMFGGGQS